MPKPKPLWHALGSCAQRLESRPAVLVGCDFDGTLCPIQERPEGVHLDDRARHVLSRLARIGCVFVGVFSGRSLDDLARRVDVPGLLLAGSGGLEAQDEKGRRRRHADAEQSAPDELKQSLREWCARFPGGWMEEKQVAVAVHYRAVAPHLQPAFRAGVRRRAAPFRERVRLVHGKKVFEILPASFGGKPDGVREWVEQHPAPRRLIFYFGDDANDEDCYPLVQGLHGITVAVGRPVTKAEYGLESHVEVVWFLEWLERELALRLQDPVNAGRA
jgi:trehalose-phosphatase